MEWLQGSRNTYYGRFLFNTFPFECQRILPTTVGMLSVPTEPWLAIIHEQDETSLAKQNSQSNTHRFNHGLTGIWPGFCGL